ncbi:MAG: hypothetical protein WAS07_11225, partial [Micropruina sp.]
VQRLSTILEFTGNYVDEAGNSHPGFTLEAGEYLKGMEGFIWPSSQEIDSEEVGVKSNDKVFDAALRRDFKRAKLEFRIITKGSDPSAKYDLFQRLNSGSVLSPQEARNCLLVMMNRTMFLLIQALAQEASFVESLQLSERQEDQAYRDELVLRFFAQMDFTGSDKELRKEYGEYITDWMRSVAETGELTARRERAFRTSLRLIHAALGPDSFRRWDGARHLGPFSISGYEFITSGLVANLETWEVAESQALAERIRGVWSDQGFKESSGTGVSPRRRVPRLVNRARRYFA